MLIAVVSSSQLKSPNDASLINAPLTIHSDTISPTGPKTSIVKSYL